MSYINKVSVGGNTYNLRDEEAIHDVSNLATKAELNGKLDSSALNNYMTTEQVNNALQDKVSASQLDNFATLESLNTKVDKNELNNYATKEDLNNVSGGGSNVNMFVEGTTLVLNVSSGGSGPGGGGSEEVMAEFAVSSNTTNDQGHQVVALEGLTNLYNDEQRRQELQNNTFSFKWVDSNGTERGQNGQFQLANSANEEFPAGPGNEKMVIDWNAGTLTFINTSLPEGVVKVVLIKHSNGGSGPNFTDVYTTNITNVSRPDSTKYVYTVEDSGFANMISTMASYSPDHWNGAFRDNRGSQNGFGEFSIIAATSSADGFDGYKAPGPEGIILAFNTADNTITYNQSADIDELRNATVFVLRRVL